MRIQTTFAPVPVTVGVDTHAEVHVAAVLDPLGRLLGTCTVPTSAAGYAELVAWASRFGPLTQIGIEGTGSYGAGLARWLRARGHAVVEVDRPNRQVRRRRGKSDPVDAEAAARAVLAGTATARPKAGDGAVEAIRALHLDRRSAMKARTQAANQLHALVVTAPEGLRAQLRGLSIPQLVTRAAASRARARPTTPLDATKLALRSIARRYQQLSAEIAALEAHLGPLVAATAPALVAVKGVGLEIATTLLVVAGDTPERLRSEAAFAQLCGVAPVPASSGKTVRHRLNRGGERDANRALYLLAVGRMGWDPSTRAYVARRTAAGLTKPEIIRCLKRYLARELYPLLVACTATPRPAAASAPAAANSDTTRLAILVGTAGSLANQPVSPLAGAGSHPQGRSVAEEPRQGLDAPAGAEPPMPPQEAASPPSRRRSLPLPVGSTAA